MKYLYVIPARGGSKGIPGKNIKPFRGVPLIGHTIRVALEIAGNAGDVCVSTDSDGIAAVAADFGAPVPFMRPAELATDTAGSRGVILHAVDAMNARAVALGQQPYDTVVLLQPTSPLRTAADVRSTIEAYERARGVVPASPSSESENAGADMAVTVVRSDANPYYNLFEAGADGFLHISKGDGRYTRRQDAPPVWEFNGAVYVIDVEALRHEELSRLKHIVPVEMPACRSVDLDTPADWERAETMHNS